MLFKEDIIKRIKDNNKSLTDSQIDEVIRFIARYLRNNKNNFEAIELPYVGFLYRKVENDSQKNLLHKSFYRDEYKKNLFYKRSKFYGKTKENYNNPPFEK